MRLWVATQARDVRLRRRLADRLEEAVAAAPGEPPDAERRILLIAAVLRSPLPLPDDGVRAARSLTRDVDRLLLRAADDERSEELLRVEELLGMIGRHRRAARAIADGEIVARPRSASP